MQMDPSTDIVNNGSKFVQIRSVTLIKIHKITEQCKQSAISQAGHVSLEAPAPKLCSHLLWHFTIQQQSTVPQSGHALLTQVSSMYS